MRIFSILFFFLLFVCYAPQAEAQKKQTTPTKKMKKQATTLGLEIIKSYFEGDCKKDFLPHFHTTIFALDGDGAIALDDKLKERLCEMHARAVKDKTRTYAQYLMNYKIQILTKPEYEKLLGKIEFDYYTPQESDLLFVGSMPSSEATLPNFIFDDMFYFMLRKIGKKWKIIAVGG
jgi:hypothetical protein